MRKLLVFQHVPFEPLGTIHEQFKDSGFRIRYINFDRQPDQRVDVGRYHGLVVLGGPMAADQTDRFPHLVFETDAIASAIDLGLPVLGICLGAQLIAASLGGRILRGRAPEFGWVAVSPTAAGMEDPLIRHLSRSEQIFQWHSDTFTLPHGSVHLAESPACAYQAFRFREHVYGLQFHLEADRALIRRWLDTPHHIKELNDRGISLNNEAVMAETTKWAPRAAELGKQVFGEFINRFYAFRRRRAHGSR